MGFVADAFGSFAGGVGDFLFGSEGEPGQVIDTSVPEFKSLKVPVAQKLSEIIDKKGGQFEGPLASPITGAETEFLTQLQNLTRQPSELQGQARDVLSSTLQGDFLSPESNPFLQDAIASAVRPVTERFNEVTLPNVISQFKRAGQTLRSNPDFTRTGSSAFLNQARLAEKDLSRQIGDIATNISFQNFANERARQAQAVESAERISNQDIDNTIKTLQASELPRLIEQLGIDKGLGEFNRRISTLLQALGLGGQLVQKQPLAIPGTPPQQGALGNLATAAAIGFSNSNLKNKIQDNPKVLDRVKRLKIDKWKYKSFIGDDSEHIGPYAEQWAEEFGGDRMTINLIDALGVSLAAIKELSAKVEALEAKNG